MRAVARRCTALARRLLLAPIDGTWTLGHDELIQVIEQIRPALVIPMHYFTARILDSFIAKLGGRYRVRTNPGPAILLSRAELPKPREVLILPGH